MARIRVGSVIVVAGPSGACPPACPCNGQLSLLPRSPEADARLLLHGAAPEVRGLVFTSHARQLGFLGT